VLQELVELLARDHQQLDRALRHHVGRGEHVVDQGHLAEQLAALERRQLAHLAALALVQPDLGDSLLQDVERAAQRVLRDDQLAVGALLDVADLRQLHRLLEAELGEQRRLLQKLDAREGRHVEVDLVHKASLGKGLPCSWTRR
jgi:hypothetical protein